MKICTYRPTTNGNLFTAQYYSVGQQWLTTTGNVITIMEVENNQILGKCMRPFESRGLPQVLIETTIEDARKIKELIDRVDSSKRSISSRIKKLVSSFIRRAETKPKPLDPNHTATILPFRKPHKCHPNP